MKYNLKSHLLNLECLRLSRLCVYCCTLVWFYVSGCVMTARFICMRVCDIVSLEKSARCNVKRLASACIIINTYIFNVIFCFSHSMTYTVIQDARFYGMMYETIIHKWNQANCKMISNSTHIRSILSPPDSVLMRVFASVCVCLYSFWCYKICMALHMQISMWREWK